MWQDPEFDAGAPAVYYLRVIEIPTPRWSTILSVKRGLPLPPEVEPHASGTGLVVADLVHAHEAHGVLLTAERARELTCTSSFGRAT